MSNNSYYYYNNIIKSECGQKLLLYKSPDIITKFLTKRTYRSVTDYFAWKPACVVSGDLWLQFDNQAQPFIVQSWQPLYCNT